MRDQRRENFYSLIIKVANNLIKLVASSYILEGVILALTPLFYLSKVTEDIRMVFDTTTSGIDNSLWY